MKIIAEIYRSPGLCVQGKSIFRTAVRGVILRGSQLLMVYSSVAGDYKFPGGGVHAGETHAQALKREIREECGGTVTHIGKAVGAVIEYKYPKESDYQVFKMTSHYYYCAVDGKFTAQQLDGYERDLGFTPAWVEVEQALQKNQALLRTMQYPEWLVREIFMIEYLQQSLFPSPRK